MRRLLPVLITATALLALAGVASAAQPVPTIGAATNVTLTGATLNATVDPGNENTNVTFQYDDNNDFSSPSAPIPATQGAIGGGTAQAVSAPATGLTTGATYYFRVTATNSGAPVASPAVAPYPSFIPSALQAVTTGVFSAITSSTAHIAGAVTPNGLATQARFRYGTSPSSQQFTPVVAVGSGTASVPLEADLAGLPAFTRIYYTLRTDRAAPTVANAVEGPQLSFVTERALTGVSASASRTKFGVGSTVSGSVSGAGISGVTVDAQIQRYPFTEAFTTVATGKTTTSGRYAVRLPKLYAQTRVRVVTSGTAQFVSPTRTINVEPSVGLIVRSVGGKRVFSGSVRPPLGSAARARIQRKSGSRWITVRTLRLTTTSSTISRYTTTLSRRKQKTSYRVQVRHSRPELATGISRTRTLG